eukprot:474887-Rhodomonas_salina.3
MQEAATQRRERALACWALDFLDLSFRLLNSTWRLHIRCKQWYVHRSKYICTSTVPGYMYPGGY